MVESYVLIETEVGRAGKVAREASRFGIVKCADAVTGPYDVVIRAQAEDLEQINSLVDGLQTIEGVTRTMTCFVLVCGTHLVQAGSAGAGETAA